MRLDATTFIKRGSGRVIVKVKQNSKRRDAIVSRADK